jgi:hypothetical protein
MLKPITNKSKLSLHLDLVQGIPALQQTSANSGGVVTIVAL